MDSRVGLLQQNTFREFTYASFTDGDSQLVYKFACYTPVIALFLGKKSSITTHFASKNTVAITLPADGCVFNFFGLGDPDPTTDDYEPYSLSHNEPKSHLQPPDAKENQLLT